MSKVSQVVDDSAKPLIDVLENGIREVLKNKKAKTSEKVAAISAGAKLLAIKNKLDDGSGGFFG